MRGRLIHNNSQKYVTTKQSPSVWYKWKKKTYGLMLTTTKLLFTFYFIDDLFSSKPGHLTGRPLSQMLLKL